MKRFLLILLALLLLAASAVSAVFFGKSAARRALGAPEDDPEKTAGEPQDDPAPDEGTEEKAGNRVHFLAAGDIVLHESVFLDANRRAGGSGASGSVGADSPYDFLSMYARVADTVSKADLALVNQETLIAANASGIPEGYPGFTGPRAAGDTLSAVGFDLVSMGNNHMLDQGSAGLRRSMDYWKTQSAVTTVGAYRTKAECDEICIVEKNGVRIALLAYLGETPGTNGNEPDSGLYIPYLDEDLVRAQVTAARTQADFVLVSVHWGTEGTYTPNSEQKSYTALFASLGVDAVLGSHPHVLQPIEWVERTGYAPGGKMLVCYSLGDFLSHTQLAGGLNRKGNLLGGFVTFDLVKEETGAALTNVRFTPTVSHYDGGEPMDTGFCIYPLSEYTSALLSRFGDTEAGFTSVDQLQDIVKQNIPDEFLRS